MALLSPAEMQKTSVPEVDFQKEPFFLGKGSDLTAETFHSIIYYRKMVKVSAKCFARLDETRGFVADLLERNVKVYGLTTGFADLRDRVVSPLDAAKLSVNIIRSHDAGIGRLLPREVVLGAMVCRANSLSQGYSAFKKESLETLVGMIQHKIIPQIPIFGSLGASGDLAFLARLGRAMMGDDVVVQYNGVSMSARRALFLANVPVFVPEAKEGLALTNGTSFMASELALACMQEVHEFENTLALQVLFLNSVQAIDAAFYQCIQEVRRQPGQEQIAHIFRNLFDRSPFVDTEGVQNDYCIRCLPQILGPGIEPIFSAFRVAFAELNAVTDNPLIFKDEEISPDVARERIHSFNGSRFVVLSGGNFHGQCITQACDTLSALNAKIALTMERQLTYVLNPSRNKSFPPYLIADEKQAGLFSGHMIVQYSGNAIAQQIAQLAHPYSAHNITSGNESEDVVSYGASAAISLLTQLKTFHQLTVLHLTTMLQAYSITRQKLLSQDIAIPKDLPCEQIFQLCEKELASIGIQHPIKEDVSFDKVYQKMDQLLRTTKIREIIGFPLGKQVHSTVAIAPLDV